MNTKVSLRLCPRVTALPRRAGRPKGMMMFSGLEKGSHRADSKMKTGSCILLSSLSLEEEPRRMRIQTFEKGMPGGWRCWFLYGGVMTSGKTSVWSPCWWWNELWPGETALSRSHWQEQDDRTRRESRPETGRVPFSSLRLKSPISIPHLLGERLSKQEWGWLSPSPSITK